mgnify:FL=1
MTSRSDSTRQQKKPVAKKRRRVSSERKEEIVPYGSQEELSELMDTWPATDPPLYRKGRQRGPNRD